MKFNCAFCGKEADRPAGHVNRARAKGNNVYCSKKCSVLGRRDGKSEEQKKAEKAEYDRKYRSRNKEKIAENKAEYFRRTYNPEAAAIERKKRMPKHLEYCRRPEYRAKKKQYDRERRAMIQYGKYAECFLLTQDIRAECLSRSTDYEIRLERGDFTKRKERKNGNQNTISNKPETGPMGNLERGERGQNGRIASRQRCHSGQRDFAHDKHSNPSCAAVKKTRRG